MTAPRVFISYSHDDQAHKNWALTLATRLVKNGVDVTLDQWDIGLGGDLPHFMESGLTAADRVVAVCTPAYVEGQQGTRWGRVREDDPDGAFDEGHCCSKGHPARSRWRGC